MGCVALSLGVFSMVLAMMVIIHLWIVSPMLVSTFRSAQENETLAQLTKDDEKAHALDLRLKSLAATALPQNADDSSVSAKPGSLATPADVASDFFRSQISSLAELV